MFAKSLDCFVSVDSFCLGRSGRQRLYDQDCQLIFSFLLFHFAVKQATLGTTQRI